MTYAPWLVWLLPVCASILVPIVSLLDNRATKWFAASISATTAGIAIYQATSFTHAFSESLGSWVVYSNISLEVNVDGLSVFLSTFVALLSFVIVLYAVENMKRESGQVKFYSLVLLFIGAMLGLVMAGNLVQLYFFWEIVGICSALLIAFWSERESARKAGMKAFVVTRFGDAALFIGVILTLTKIHTTTIDSIIIAVHSQGVSREWTVIGFLFLIGAMGKSAQIPLHAWLPDAMEGPTPVSALIHAATMVNAGVYLLVRLSPIFSSSVLLSDSVLVVGSLSLVIGAACACAERDLKRILAYSTISQIGLMFVAIGIGSFSGAIYQLVSQGSFKALAFMAAGSVIEAVGSRNIDDMGGLARFMKYTYVGFLLSMLSMVGLPPLLGFWAKDTILSSALSVNGYVFLIVSLASILTSLYGFRALFKVFHGPRKIEARESGPLMIIPMMLLVLTVTVGWLLLTHQDFIQPTLSQSLSSITLIATLSVLATGLIIAYVFYLRSKTTPTMIQRNPFLKLTVNFLAAGAGFDIFYSGTERYVLRPTVQAAKKIQSGQLESNMALLLSALVVLVILIAYGVL